MLQDSPYALWLFQETSGTTAYDISGYARDITLEAPSLANVGPNGMKSVGFTGTTDGGYVPGTAFRFTTAFSLESWVQCPSASSTSALLTTYNNDGWVWAVGNTSHKVSFYNSSTGGAWKGGGGTSIDDDKWHHLALTSNPSGNIYFYVDGVLDQTATGATPSAGDNITLGLAHSHDRDVWHFGGRFAAAGIYPSELSPDRITAHYQAGLRSGAVMG